MGIGLAKMGRTGEILVAMRMEKAYALSQKEHLITYSSSKYLLNTYYVPWAMLCTRDKYEK